MPSISTGGPRTKTLPTPVMMARYVQPSALSFLLRYLNTTSLVRLRRHIPVQVTRSTPKSFTMARPQFGQFLASLHFNLSIHSSSLFRSRSTSTTSSYSSHVRPSCHSTLCRAQVNAPHSRHFMDGHPSSLVSKILPALQDPTLHVCHAGF